MLSGARMTAKTSAKAPSVSTPQAAAGKPSTSATGHAAAGSGSSKATTRGTAESGLSLEQGQGLGIDTCTVPSAATMSDWLASPYRVISTYLGGANWACTYGDFTDSWVGQVAAEGWQFIPIWVGPQASCTKLTNTTVIDPSTAAAQGAAEAASAVAAAQEFGYGQGTPIYYDMESYDNSNTSCSQATLTFLGAWTAGLHSAGYLSGVYSSAATGIADLASQYTNTAYQSPDEIWFADWNTNPNLTNPYAPAADWQGAIMHQYYGDHDETWGGATLTLDSDVIDAAVAGDPNAAATGQPTVTDEPAEVSVAPGGNGSTRLEIQGGRQTSVVHWHADPPAGVSVWPESGTAVVSGSGQASISLKVWGAATLASGRYDVPITATANGEPITETFLLVSSGSSVPSSVVLYAADAQSMAIAQSEAQQFALPASNLTGNFERLRPGDRGRCRGEQRAVPQCLRLDEPGRRGSRSYAVRPPREAVAERCFRRFRSGRREHQRGDRSAVRAVRAVRAGRDGAERERRPAAGVDHSGEHLPRLRRCAGAVVASRGRQEGAACNKSQYTKGGRPGISRAGHLSTRRGSRNPDDRVPGSIHTNLPERRESSESSTVLPAGSVRLAGRREPARMTAATPA
jgi:hypothetical protein